MRMKCHCHRSWQGPRSCRPDDREYRLAFRDARVGQTRVNSSRIGLQAITDVNRRTGVVLVLHLSFRQRSAVMHAPVNRTQAFVDESLLKELVKRADHDGFILW